MSKKRVHSLLKGVAVTGIAVGGASALSDINMVYANELDSLSTNSGEITLPVENSLSKENIEEAKNNTPAEDVPVATSELTDEQLSESAAESLSTEEAVIASTSTSLSESLVETTNSLSTEIEETSASESELASNYEANGYANEGLDELETNISGLMTDEAALRQKAIDEEGNVLKTGSYYGTNTLNDLAVSLIRYKLTLEGEITDSYEVKDATTLNKKENTFIYHFWSGSGNQAYYLHHYCIKYISALDGTYHEEYYDYATADADGNSLIQGYDANNNNATDVQGINILKKIPVYNEGRMNGDYYQRTDFKVTGQYSVKKGEDWYKTIDYLADVLNRATIPTEISSLSTKNSNLSATLNSVLASASDSVIASQSANEERLASLATSESASNSASSFKSEMLSLSASESLSESESASLSESAAAVMAANNSQSVSASEGSVAPAVSENMITTLTSAIVTEETEAVNNANAPMPHATIQNTMNEADVPLAVVEDDLESYDEQSYLLGDEDTPLSREVDTNTRKWWFGTPAVIAGLAGTTTIKKTKKEKK